MQTIEILDKETNTKQTYVLQEEHEQEQEQEQQIEVFYFELVKKIVRATLVVFKFVSYLVISFFELLIKVIKGMFFNDYKPFKWATNGIDNIAKGYVKKNTKPHAKIRHQYEFTESEIFARNYSKIENLLKECAKNSLAINENIYKDILKRIDIIVIEAQKQALQEGYNYAKQTRYNLSNEEVYDTFVESKIMRGEGNKKYKIIEEEFNE